MVAYYKILVTTATRVAELQVVQVCTCAHSKTVRLVENVEMRLHKSKQLA